MTSPTLQKEVEVAVPKLLELARELTCNKISDNCKFILTEIKNNENKIQRQLNKKENDLKIPLTLQEQMPALQHLYQDFYDINLQIYRTKKDLTIIDIRYYPKSSLEADYRAMVIDNELMLHCKVIMPPWVNDKRAKFDINWEHKEWLISWKLFLARLKLKSQKQ